MTVAFTNAAESGWNWTLPDDVAEIEYLVVGGGGGGATGDASCATPGAGLESEISGARVEYGRGGAGATVEVPVAVAGADGTGAGGSGGGNLRNGAPGGSGIVILRYALAGGESGQDSPKIEPWAGGDTWHVEVALDAAKVAPAFADGKDGHDAIRVADDDVSLAIGNAKPGLWYGVASASDILTLSEADVNAWQLCVGGGTLTWPDLERVKDAKCGFYRVVVTAKGSE